MIVELAGINIPKKIIDLIKEYNILSKAQAEALTPETISAAYARISRSKKSVDELVDEAIDDTEGTRRSVSSILGMGHHSIADHAMFNFNIKKVSRLVVESIEERRLAGYTEKSQRYVTLDGDYVKPKEFNKEDMQKFEKLIALQNEFYFKVNKKLFEHLKKKNKGGSQDKDIKNFMQKLERSAKEDTRYSLSLATEAQLGCSYTGQTLEHAIRINKYSELLEQREFAKALYDRAIKVAPSLIQLSDPELFKELNKGAELEDDNFKYTKKNLKELVEKTFKSYEETSPSFYRYLLSKENFSSNAVILI